MADSKFSNVRALVQGGSLTNLATASPWTVSHFGGTGLTLTAASRIRAESGSIGRAATLCAEAVASLDMALVGSTVLAAGRATLVVGASGNQLACELDGVQVGSLYLPLSSQRALFAIEYGPDGANENYFFRATGESSGGTVTTTASVSLTASAGSAGNLVVAGGPLIGTAPATPSHGTVNVATTRPGVLANAVPHIVSFSQANAAAGFTDRQAASTGGSLSITASRAGSADVTYTITNTAGLTLAGMCSVLVVGIAGLIGGSTSFLSGASRVTTATTATGANWLFLLSTPGLSFPAEPGTPIAATTVTGTGLVMPQVVQGGVYGAIGASVTQRDVISLSLPAANASMSLSVALQPALNATASMANIATGLDSLVAQIGAVGFTASWQQIGAGQYIINTERLTPGAFTLSASLSIDTSWIPNPITTLHAMRVTTAARYTAVGGVPDEFPTLPWPTTSIPAGGGGSSDTNTLLLMHFDEGSGTTLADETGRTFTTTDIATHTTASGKFSRGVFPASNTWDGAVGSSPVNISGGVFTIEFFVARRGSGATTTYETVFAQTTNSGTWADGLVVFVSGDSNIVQAYLDGIPTPAAIIGNTPGVWQHIALVRSGDGATDTKWYVNGVGEGGFATGYATHANVNPNIGNTAPSAGYRLNSVGIDELRISNVARYTADFTPPTAPFEIGVVVPADVPFYFPVNTEASGAALVNLGFATTDHSIPAAGTNRPVTADAPGGGRAVQLNGSSNLENVITGLTPVSVTIGDGDYTAELYVYFNTLSPNKSILAMDGNDYGGKGVLQTYDSNRLAWNSNTSFAETGVDSIVASTWYHVAYSRQAGTGRLFLNGVLKGTSADIELVFNSAKVGPVIGFLASSGFGGTIDGFVDEVAVTLSAKYTANFTPKERGKLFYVDPGIPANVRYYYPFLTGDGSQIPNRGSVVTELQTTSGALSTHPDGGVVFGDGGPINGYDISSQALLSTCTLEGWAKWNIGGSADIFGEPSFGFFLYSGSIYFRMGSYDTPGFTLTTNWVHLAAVRAGATSETVSVYINGALHHTFASGTSLPPGQFGGSLRIGSSVNISSADFNGYVDDVIVTEGAKYTANFTPPTRGNAFPYKEPSNVDVTCAGYNDLDTITGAGTFNTQLTAPDAYFFSAATLDDSVSTGDAYTVDGNSINFTGPRTLANTTCTGTFVYGTPQNFDSDVTLDDTVAVSTFYCDVPVEWTGSATLEDVTSFGIHATLAPATFTGSVVLDDISSSVSGFDVLSPTLATVNATVPVATLVSRATRTYVDAMVPAAQLSASIQFMRVAAVVPVAELNARIQYIRVDATVPAATLVARAWPTVVNATVPVAELAASITPYVGAALDATVPAATLSAWGGTGLVATVPMATLSASATVVNTLRLDAGLPRTTLAGFMTTGGAFRLDANVAVPTLSSWTGAQLDGTVPVATGFASAMFGGAFVLNASVPMATAEIGASSINLLSLSGTVPVASRDNWLAVAGTVPSAGVFASMSQVVATTTVAYNFTMANAAMTRYPAYPFTQVIRMGNTYYGVAPDGLYELGGETDNGVAIPWSFETCMDDFKEPKKKTVASVFIGGKVPANMTVTTKTGDLPSGTDAHTTKATAVLRNHRQKLGLGRRSRFFAFGLSAPQGATQIEDVTFEVATTTRRM